MLYNTFLEGEDKGGEEGEGEEEQRGGVNLIDVVSFDRGVFECIQ